MSAISTPQKQVKVTEAVTQVAIHAHRYVKGYKREDGVFVIDHGHSPQFVAASPDFPATLELPVGYKLDGGMKPLDGEAAKPIVLKKHYDDSGAQHPQTAVVETKPELKPGKRPSDKSPV